MNNRHTFQRLHLREDNDEDCSVDYFILLDFGGDNTYQV
jgi:hypothetical protein